jgi:hypothetical protein
LAASASGSATTISLIASQLASASTDRSSTVRPPSSRNCLGTVVPRRVRRRRRRWQQRA